MGPFNNTGPLFLKEKEIKNMLTKKIKYTDYNGTEREETFCFNLTKAELMEMEMSTSGGLAEMIQNIVQTQDAPAIIKIFKDLVLKAYGEKSPDGKRFIKMNDAGVPLSLGFSQTEAYSQLFMELATDADKAAEFINGIVPADMQQDTKLTPEQFAVLNNK